MRLASTTKWWRWACLALCWMNCEATIRLVESGRAFRSWPDHELGPQLADGAVYKARLQQIQGNSHLCFAELNWNVTVPDDGLPVALLVKNGICSYETKAKLASKYIWPRGVVKFLIIDGSYYNLRSADDLDENHESNRPAFQEFEIKSVHYQEAQSVMSSIVTNLVDAKDDLQSADITMSVLHVSLATGYSLLEHLLRQRPSITAAGGSLLELTGDSPSEKGEKTRMIWMSVMAIMGLACCLCLMSTISSIMEATEPSRPPHVRPRQRRLTPWQVRKKFPLGVFEGGQLNFLCNQRRVNHSDNDEEANEQENLPVLESQTDTDSHSFLQPPSILTEDTCIICLDDYVAGDKLRYLPCRHAFHSKCITKWLTERSATCPLCKIDLYESDNEDEDENEESYDNHPLSSSWNSVPPEAHTIESEQRPVQEEQSHSQGRWWHGTIGALGRWGGWNFRGQQSTVSSGISLLTEPLLQEGNDATPTHDSTVIALDVTP